MSTPYIKQMRVQDFGCVQDATLDLTRLHALIGPNDSGKTTLLRAVRKVLIEAGSVLGFEANGVEDPTILPSQKTTLSFSLANDRGAAPLRFTRPYSSKSTPISFSHGSDDFAIGRGGTRFLSDSAKIKIFSIPESSFFRGSPRWLHLSARSLREPGVLFAEGEQVLLGQDGSRLPAVYDAILNQGDDTFRDIAQRCRVLFQSVRTIRLKNVSTNTKAFEVELRSGQSVQAAALSDGLLYFLAFSAIEHVSPPSVLLIEEPENGLHPSRVADVMRVLRRLSERVQIVLATHSPFVINELQGDEVTVVTRPDGQGTKVRRLSDTPNFAERSKVHALGELWVSYADGKNEEPLLTDVEGGV